MPRTLGIDYGEKRVGLALSDSTGTVATPYRVLQVTSPKALLQEIAACVSDQEIARIVVGLPLRMDGARGPAADRAQAFADRLKEAVDVMVTTWDERFSTVTAENALIEGGTRRGKRRHVVDKLAAQIFLQHYLDAQAGLPPLEQNEA